MDATLVVIISIAAVIGFFLFKTILIEKPKTVVDYLDGNKEYQFSCYCVFSDQETAHQFSVEMKSEGLENTVKLSQNKEKWLASFNFSAQPKTKEHERVERLPRTRSEKPGGAFGVMDVSDPGAPGVLVQ